MIQNLLKRLCIRLSVAIFSSICHCLSFFLSFPHSQTPTFVLLVSKQTPCTSRINGVCLIHRTLLIALRHSKLLNWTKRCVQEFVRQCEQTPTPGELERTVKDVAWCVPYTKAQIQPVFYRNGPSNSDSQLSVEVLQTAVTMLQIETLTLFNYNA